MKGRRSSDAAPVASGRIERKRAHDREAQRASRAKTKAYIAHLEKTVADLTESSGDDRALYLAQHASKQSNEIENLQGLVTKIRTLIQDSFRPELGEHSSVPIKIEGDNRNHNKESSVYNSPPDSNACSSDSPKSQASADIPRASADESNDGPHNTTRNLVVLGENLLCEENDDCSFFQRLNRVLGKLEACPDHLSTRAEDEDILVRAVVEGWDAAERVHHFDIVWRFLRAYDEGFWYRCSPINRLTNFWVMRSVLLHKMCPSNQPRRATPPFMNPTLHQMVVTPHQPLADYYVWPKIRDMVIDRGGLEPSGRASIAFIQSIKFDWPYELRDVYLHNTTTGMFELSPTFNERFNDLANYRLDMPKKLTGMCTPTRDPTLHPALACANEVGANETLLPWHSATTDNSANLADYAGVLKDPLAAAKTTTTASMPHTPAGWLPSMSMDISSEAAFLEFAMDAWPVL